jgi:hypothetical protein
MKRFADFGTSFWPQLARFDLARPLGRTVTLIRAKPEGRRPNGPERTGNYDNDAVRAASAKPYSIPRIDPAINGICRCNASPAKLDPVCRPGSEAFPFRFMGRSRKLF